MIHTTLYAHHKDGQTHGGGGGQGNGNGTTQPGNGNGNGNGNNVPEIDGGELPLAILIIFCFMLLVKSFRKCCGDK